MASWIKCGDKFIIGDVVRWTEPVWVENPPHPIRMSRRSPGTGSVIAGSSA